MKYRAFSAAMLAAVLLLSLAACGKAQTPGRDDVPAAGASQPPELPEMTEAPEGEGAPEDADVPSGDEAWKADFEKSLLENYGVKPDHYEYLENGVYQVYVEIDGKIVPYVAVDSATGDYHG